MKMLLPALMLSVLVLSVQAQPPKVVISQVFGAGGLTNSPFSHDFVELFNASDETVSLAGWSIQYSPATNNRWATGTVILSGTIKPGHYYLVQLNGKEGVGKPLPEPDLVATVNVDISATSGKVALVSSTTALQGNCPVGNDMADLVGFGSADCSETALAPATSNTRSIIRAQNGCADTDNNAADFTAVVPGPRNGKSAANMCNGSAIKVAAVTGLPFCISETTGASGIIAFEALGVFANTTFAAVMSDASGSFTSPLVIGTAVVNGNNPTGTFTLQIPRSLSTSKLYRLRIDATQVHITGAASHAIEVINGAANVNAFSASPNADRALLKWDNPSGCYEEIMIVAKEGSSITGQPFGDGSGYRADLDFSGSGTAFDGGKVVYKGTSSGQTITGLQTGKEYFVKAFTRNGNYWSPGLEIKVKPRLLPLPGEILISQVSPQYDDPSFEYVELVNVTGKSFDLSELSISYHAASGNKAVAGNTLSGMLPPYSYWLVASKEMVTVGKTSLLRDGYLADGFAASAGQLSLLRKTDSTVIDGFGYGSIAVQTYTEGQPAPAPTSKGGFKRKAEGMDSNNNHHDFERVNNADIDLRNSQSRLLSEGAALDEGTYLRLYITGNAAVKGKTNISEKLVLLKGKLQLGAHDLTAAKAEGGSPGSYIQTNGKGMFTWQKVPEATTLLPVGNATYNPVGISRGGGIDWQVQVVDEILHQPSPINADRAVKRTWQVIPAAKPVLPAAIQLFYDGNDASQTGTGFNNQELQLWHYNTAWSAVGSLQKPVTANGMQSAGIDNWQQQGTFVIAHAVIENAVLAALPIRFTRVKATDGTEGVQVEFTNSTETDVAYYQIERSADSQHFTTLTSLHPLHNNGGEAHYQWLDKTRPSGNHFYRIKGVEKNGSFLYSPVLKVTVDRAIRALMVYPNPVKGRQAMWEATLPKGNYRLQVTGSNGQQVLQQQFPFAGGNLQQMLVLPAGTPPGLYTLQIINGSFVRQQSFMVL